MRVKASILSLIGLIGYFGISSAWGSLQALLFMVLWSMVEMIFEKWQRGKVTFSSFLGLVLAVVLAVPELVLTLLGFPQYSQAVAAALSGLVLWLSSVGNPPPIADLAQDFPEDRRQKAQFLMPLLGLRLARIFLAQSLVLVSWVLVLKKTSTDTENALIFLVLFIISGVIARYAETVRKKRG